MDFNQGGSFSDRQRQTAAEIARKKVLAAYSSTAESIKNLPPNSKDVLLKNRQPRPILTSPTYQTPQYQPTPTEPISPFDRPETNQPDNFQTAQYQRTPLYSYPNIAPPDPSSNNNKRFRIIHLFKRHSKQPTPPHELNSTTLADESPAATLKDAAVNQEAINEEWKKYHSAWQDYYKNYYANYYAKAAQTYLATEKLKTERIATGKTQRIRNFRKLIPVGIVLLLVLGVLFLQYNRLIITPIIAYMAPDTNAVSSSLEAIDPSINQTVSPEPRLIIPKLNIDVPVTFNISTTEVAEAMNHGVAQFSIPGANAMPGQIGNLVLSGHSSGDIYSNNPYQYIFASLERINDGDLIYVNYDSVRYTYQVTGRSVVEPTDVNALIYETDKPVLTLITCTPLGTSRYRLLITAEQISPAYSSDNTAEPSEPDSDSTDQPSTDSFMPSNEPSFFENLWNSIFSH